jgi:hypothetical protein
MLRRSSELPAEFYSQFKLFHELMSIKIREILLVASPYDAYVLEEDGSLATRIITEYSGLNLSMPPRVTRVSSGEEAIGLLQQKRFDMVITMPFVQDMDGSALALRIQGAYPKLPVILLGYSVRTLFPAGSFQKPPGIERVYVWSGNSDLLLAIVKNAEDRLNIVQDTTRGNVRVLVLVEDSPVFYSSLLPLLYKEIVQQTQAVLHVGLNEEHRLLRMRSRPKIVLAETFEEAAALIDCYRDYLIGVISDTRIPREGRLDPEAGIELLRQTRRENPDIPVLLMSSESSNREKARSVAASFLDKNSPTLPAELHEYFLEYLGFGDFVFRMPDGREIGRASNLRTLERIAQEIPDASLVYHASRNHFSNWLMARSEFALASSFREVKTSDFADPADLRLFIVSGIRKLRHLQQKGIVTRFKAETFDAEVMDFVKIGEGSMGGKARGLAFLSFLLHQRPDLLHAYPGVSIQIPKSLVITTDGFEAFMRLNGLQHCYRCEQTDAQVARTFLDARMPENLLADLQAYLSQVSHPLSVRSSSLLEDAHFQPYAGLYHTYMIPNNDPDPAIRLRQLADAIKLVYASTFSEDPRAFSRSTVGQLQAEAMAVIVQEIVGERYGDHFYPAISGVAHSHNFYPFGRMLPEDGIANIALGMGKTVVEGESSLRFCPKHPGILPQFQTVSDILGNCQRRFYALNLDRYPETLLFSPKTNLTCRQVDEAENEFPVRLLSSRYDPEEDRIRDTGGHGGVPVLTFAPVLRHNLFPLSALLSDLLDFGMKGMGCPVEIEFAVNLGTEEKRKNEFVLLQIRPLMTDIDKSQVVIRAEDIQEAFLVSHQALGQGIHRFCDLLYVRPETFRPEGTEQIAAEIGSINARLVQAHRKYLLIGPGRWGSADKWLGIPVKWHQISGVGGIVEIRDPRIPADPSQGSHFFQNITSLGIPYITVDLAHADDAIAWHRLHAFSVETELQYVRHIRIEPHIELRIDTRANRCVAVLPQSAATEKEAMS